MEWFRQAKDSQGSVATKSLMQAKQANRNGCYVVGNAKKEYFRFIKEEATLNEVIELIVQLEDGAGANKISEKIYKLDEIHDLQSRLMLLGGDSNTASGENKQVEKDYFVQVRFYIKGTCPTYDLKITTPHTIYFATESPSHKFRGGLYCIAYCFM